MTTAQLAREQPIMEEVTRILAEDGWRALRTDPVSDRGRGKGPGEVGMADYMYIRYLKSSRIEYVRPDVGSKLTIVLKPPASETLWIEYKRSQGGVVSKAQTEWHTKERARGALTLIAGIDFIPSVDGFRDWYQKSGLQRRVDL